MLLSILALAVAGPNACLDQNSTVAMVDCFTRQTKQADARLNAAYKAARARVPPRQSAALQAAQRAWITYRAANCRAYALGEGTITQVEAAQCALETTSRRAEELEAFNRRN